MNDLTFKVDDKEYYILNYVKNPNTNKTYILYTESKDSDTVYASTYSIVKGELILDEITTDEEWDYLDKVLESMEDK